MQGRAVALQWWERQKRKVTETLWHPCIGEDRVKLTFVHAHSSGTRCWQRKTAADAN